MNQTKHILQPNSRSRQTRPTQDGFTLIEVLGALAIGMVLVGLIAPAINTGIQSYRLTGAARQVANEIQNARYRALRNNRVSSFLLLPTAKRFGVDGNIDGDITVGASDTVIDLQSTVSFTTLTTPPSGASGATVISSGTKGGFGFTPRGTLTPLNSSGQPDYTPASLPANGFVIYLTSGGRFAAVTISPVGRTRSWVSSNGVTWF